MVGVTVAVFVGCGMVGFIIVGIGNVGRVGRGGIVGFGV